ncbi:response regulator [Bacillus massiliglaciei]|uniref:response regulator n=1 Tax=Bacillus massiliglaciei TaxID=1816693 RepID=UPI000B2886C8|nr:response regulator [Bacillus massiliglaciei]
MKTIRVLLIEDDPMVQEVNRQFIERLEGFQVIDTAANGQIGLTKIKQLKPDLVILDIFMPSLNGIEALTQIRKDELDVDVIIISAANDRQTIRKSLQNGAFDYLIKPFKFERLQHTLQQYQAFFMEMKPGDGISQNQIDRMMFQVDDKKNEFSLSKDMIPKGLNIATLEQVVHFMKNKKEALSAEEVADGIGIARVTARRYLDFLYSKELLKLDVQYGGIGRPVNKYILNH